jgi:hypothetical protein
MPKIIDCSIGFNETDMLRIRTAELASVVDAFVVVESEKSHTGERKPILFPEAIRELTRSGYNINHYIIDDMPGVMSKRIELCWILENFQRNCILRPLSTMNLSDDDIILISDIDEIPRASHVAQLPSLLTGDTKVVIFEQIMKKFFLNNMSQLKSNNVPWLGTVACTYGVLKNILPQGARIGDLLSPRSACLAYGYNRDLYPYERRLYEAGWHFSSMGGVSAYIVKARSIVEGDITAPVEIDGASRFGMHNDRRFREENSDLLTQFIADNAPDLKYVRGPASDAVAELDLPDVIKQNPAAFQFLFYFGEPIE